MYIRKNKSMQVWNDMSVSKWQNFHFKMNYLFKYILQTPVISLLVSISLSHSIFCFLYAVVAQGSFCVFCVVFVTVQRVPVLTLEICWWNTKNHLSTARVASFNHQASRTVWTHRGVFFSLTVCLYIRAAQVTSSGSVWWHKPRHTL